MLDDVRAGINEDVVVLPDAAIDFAEMRNEQQLV